MTTGKKLISIVIPAYNEEDCVEELARQLTGVMHELDKYDFEVLIVENGSKDATWSLLQRLRQLISALSRFVCRVILVWTAGLRLGSNLRLVMPA